MKNLLLSASALLCAAAWSQSPSLPYRSVFTDTVKGVETQSIDWKRANARVAELPRGHMDALKWEKAHASPAPAPAASTPNPDLRSEDAVAMALQSHPARPAADTQKAWTNAVAAQQSAKYFRDVRDAAEAGAELARRMAQVGNWSRLDQAREQLLLADTAAQLARAQNAAFSDREKLIRQIGATGPQANFVLPDHLPDLPASAGALRELPAQAKSEVREAYFAYRTAFDLAVHYRDEIVPLRKFINDELVLRYSAMLVSVWDLLADTRAQSLSIHSAIEAQRDFWLADTDLQTALTAAVKGN